MTGKKEEKILPPRQEVACRSNSLQFGKINPGKPPKHYDALPRDCTYAYLTPNSYATGFRILDVYKTEVDLSEMRSWLFLEDTHQQHKWGLLKTRIPYPQSRVTDLPGTRKLNYHNYCLRCLTPESTRSWRNSIMKLQPEEEPTAQNENDPDPVEEKYVEN